MFIVGSIVPSLALDKMDPLPGHDVRQFWIGSIYAAHCRAAVASSEEDYSPRANGFGVATEMVETQE